MHEIKASITGKVQMVMFRDFIQRHARSLNIVGIVRNLKDGSVEVIAQGNEDKLEKFVERLHEGPFLAKVIRVEVERREPTEGFDSFTIQH